MIEVEGNVALAGANVIGDDVTTGDTLGGIGIVGMADEATTGGTLCTVG